MKKWFPIGGGYEALFETRKVRASSSPAASGGGFLHWGCDSCLNGRFFVPWDNMTSAGVASPYDGAIIAPLTGTLRLAAFYDVNTTSGDREAVLTVGALPSADGADSAMQVTIPNGEHFATSAALVPVTQGQFLRVRGITSAAIVNGIWIVEYV